MIRVENKSEVMAIPIVNCNKVKVHYLAFASQLAQTNDFELLYDKALGGIRITGYTGASKSVVVPKKIDGIKVVACDLQCLKLKSLNVKKAVYLKELNCGGNCLTKLDVTKNAKLKVLGCYGNFLTKLDVIKNPNLKKLACSEMHTARLTDGDSMLRR